MSAAVTTMSLLGLPTLTRKTKSVQEPNIDSDHTAPHTHLCALLISESTHYQHSIKELWVASYVQLIKEKMPRCVSMSMRMGQVGVVLENCMNRYTDREFCIL